MAALAVAATCVLGAVGAPHAFANGWIQVSVVDQTTLTPIAGEGLEIDTWTVDPNDIKFVARGGSDIAPTTFSVPAGKYKLTVSDYTGAYAPQVWDHKETTLKADPVVVSEGTTTSCVVELAPDGHVSGTITDTAGNPLENIYVMVDPFDVWNNEFGGQTYTDINGHYEVGGLPGGSYVIEGQDFGGQYLYQFYPDQLSYETATPFDVAAGETLQAPTITMKVAATIDGGITTHLGVVPHDIQCAVESRDADGTWREVTSHTCNNDGTYHIGQIPPGRYRLSFYWIFNRFNRQYYPFAFDPARAKIFDIAEGQRLSGIDAVIWGDLQAPTTQAPDSATAKQGAAASLDYRVADPRPGGPTANVTIRIKSRAGKTLRTVWLPRRSVNRWHVCRYASGLPRGTYRFCVYAVDCGGNHQKRIGSNRLIVR